MAPDYLSGQPAGTYVWTDALKAYRLLDKTRQQNYRDGLADDNEEPQDMWLVDFTGLSVQRDPARPGAYGSVVVHDAIPPERLKLDMTFLCVDEAIGELADRGWTSKKQKGNSNVA